jgi:hypothetical protein
MLIDKVISKLRDHNATRIALVVCETNLGAQRLFRRKGFLAIDVLRKSCMDTDEDVFLMQRTSDAYEYGSDQRWDAFSRDLGPAMERIPGDAVEDEEVVSEE